MGSEDVLAVARRARKNGSTRFCMGAAWKGVRDGDAKFEQVLDIVREVGKLGMEVCVTLDKLLTAANPGVDHDRELLRALDLVPQPANLGLA